MFDFVSNSLTNLQIVIIVVSVALVSLLAFFKFGKFFGYVETIIHEFGHIFSAFIVGQKIAGIRLKPDTSGETLTLARKYGFGGVLTHVSGYPAPIIVGVLGVVSLFFDGKYFWLGLLVFISFIVIVFMRNFFALIPVFVLLGTVFIGLNTGEIGAFIVVSGLSVLMIVFGVKSVKNLWVVNPDAGDAAMLEYYTKMPRRFWVSVIMLFSFIMSVLVIIFGGFLFSTVETIFDNVAVFFNNLGKIY